jgi:poly-gamma-glutamate capsule biosynthesis protein CapA/YwtB (metallophosphatase superfamily)
MKKKLSVIYTIFFLIIVSQVSAQTLSIRAVGDIMMGSQTPRPVLPKDKHLNQARKMQKFLAGADIVFGNLEGVFVEPETLPQKCSESSRKAKKCYEFGMPSELSDVLVDMGFNVLSIDNNHTADYGDEGYLLTSEILSENGIHAVPKGGHVVVRVKKKRIAIVAFGFTKNSYLLTNIKHTKKIISALSKRFPIVIVSFHGGKEGKDAQHVNNEMEMFYGEKRGNLIEFAHAAIDSGADLILGHGPHVLRALSCYRNRLIAYSLGNFYTFGQFRLSGPAGIGAILEVKIDDQDGRFILGKIIPTVQIMAGVPAFDHQKKAINILMELTKADFPETPLRISSDGLIYYKSN